MFTRLANENSQESDLPEKFVAESMHEPGWNLIWREVQK